jgi:outer membrane murein-binding lipoprotein Lpp
MHILNFYTEYASRLSAALLGVVTMAVLLYGLLLLGAVSHAAARTSAEREVRNLNAKVAELESRYLVATKSLSPERAAEMGFVTPVAVATVFAEEPTLTFVPPQAR